jgi:hypothetical protein
MDEKYWAREETRLGQFVNDVLDFARNPIDSMRSAFTGQPPPYRVSEPAVEPSAQIDKGTVPLTIDEIARQADIDGVDMDYEPPRLLTLEEQAEQDQIYGDWDRDHEPITEYFRTDQGDEIKVASYATDTGAAVRLVSSGHEIEVAATSPAATQEIAAATVSHAMTEARDESEADHEPLAFGGRDANGNWVDGGECLSFDDWGDDWEQGR